MYRRVLPLLLTAVLLLSGCTAGQKNMPQKTDEKEMTGQPSDMSGEGSMYMNTTENVIYLAGGCFWGMEQLMQSIPGVIDAESGYANGTCGADADYKTVCKGNTGFRETVRVEYDPGQVSLDALLLAYFYVIDPTVENQQGNDRGSQYQTGVYYTNESAKETVERIAEHAAHYKQVGGIGVLALGSDFDGIDGHHQLETAADMPLLADALRRAGFTEDEVERIFWRNARDFFEHNL